jgi:acyl carrier protein
MNRNDFTKRLIAYINDELLEGDRPPVEADTDLFTGEVLDSLSLINLLAFVELAIGSTIPDEDIVMDRFATPGRIAAGFWGGE